MPHSNKTPFVVLHHGLFCPFSRKIRLMLDEKKSSYSLVEERHGYFSMRYLDFHPEGRGPLLIYGNKITGADSTITALIEQAIPQPSLLGSSWEEVSEIQRLCQWFDRLFYTEIFCPLFHYKIFASPAELPHVASLRRAQRAIHRHMSYISWLTERRLWLAGSHLSLADLCGAAHLSCIDYLGDIPWNNYSYVKEWYMKLKSRPSFRPFLAERLHCPPAAGYANLDF